MKVCAKCHEPKPEEAFRLRKSVSTGKHYRGTTCKKCFQLQTAVLRGAHPERYRAYTKKAYHKDIEKSRRKSREAIIKYKYGITVKDRDRMLEEQGGCAICGTNFPRGKGWCIDHSHKTGRVRAVLCAPCNVMLGHARESPLILERAAAYIEANDVICDNLLEG